jgi:hypothetical protein
VTHRQQQAIERMIRTKKVLLVALDCPGCEEMTDGAVHIQPPDPSTGFKGDFEVDPRDCFWCKRAFTEDEIASAIEQGMNIYG